MNRSNRAEKGGGKKAAKGGFGVGIRQDERSIFMGTEDYFSRRDWEALTRRDFKADGLLRYCSKLEALGSIVEFMGFNEDGELLLQGVKDNLGDIISDYAKTIKKGLNELYPVMCRFYPYNDS